MSTQDYKEVGGLIKSFRKAKGWTSLELSGKLGISLPTLSRLENGHVGPSGNVTKKLAELGMSLEDIAYALRAQAPEQTYSYRISELENRLLKIEKSLKLVLDALHNLEDKKKGGN